MIFGGIFLKRSASRSMSRRVILPERFHVVCRNRKCTPLSHSVLFFFAKHHNPFTSLFKVKSKGCEIKKQSSISRIQTNICPLGNFPTQIPNFLPHYGLIVSSDLHLLFFLYCAVSHDKLLQPAVSLCGRACCLTALSSAGRSAYFHSSGSTWLL